MKNWHLMLLLGIILTVLYVTRDPRRMAFAEANRTIASQIYKAARPVLAEGNRSGDLDIHELERVLQPYFAQGEELDRRYEAGLMPDGTRPPK